MQTNKQTKPNFQDLSIISSRKIYQRCQSGQRPSPIKQQCHGWGSVCMIPAYAYILSRSVMSDSLQLHGLCSPPGSSVHGIIQVRIPEWVAIFYCKGSSWPRDRTRVSCVSCTGRCILYHCAAGVPTWPFTKCVTLGKLLFLSLSPSIFKIG